jgi:hypothetical protein
MTEQNVDQNDVDEEVDETGNEENENDTDTSGGSWTPPSKETWEKILKAKKRYKDEAHDRRLKLEALQQKDNTGEGGDTDKAVTAARLEGENAAAAKYRGMIGTTAAKAALLAAGLKGKPDGLLKLLDYDELDIDDDGEVSGLDEQVDDLKSKYPELFARGRAQKDKDGTNKDSSGARKKMTATERLLANANAR